MLGPALSALVWTAACDRPAAPGTAARSSPSESSSPSPAKTSAADLCTRLVVHWSRKVLDGSTYGDYQSMGLSNGEYEILRDVVKAARAVRGRQGDSSAEELIGRQARAACVERYRHGAPTESPWQ